MAAVSSPNASAAFELKSAALTLVAWVPRTADLGLLGAALKRQAADSPGLLENEPVAIDLSQLRDSGEPIDFERLLALLRRHGMLPIAARSGSPAQMRAALAAGLAEAAEGLAPARPAAPPEPPPRRGDVDAASAPFDAVATLLVDKPLRSGQQVYARGGDLVVTAVVNFGAEVIADGSIHVYAPLRGRALAGARGNAAARIFSTCMEPQLISIAGTYRTTDVPLPADVAARPAQVRLDGDRLIVEAIKLR